MSPRGSGAAPVVTRVSIELTNACAKACPFCYSRSTPAGATWWSAASLVGFARDLAAHGVQALSLGGGEPLQHPEVFEALRALDGRLFRSLTTNGLPLDGCFDALVAARPDKVHVSLHAPGSRVERTRVLRQVRALEAAGIRSGVNLLVARSQLDAAQGACQQLQAAGIGLERMVLLPMRGQDTPTPSEVARVAGERRFQSMTCLAACGRSPRFASIDWQGQAAWCSYTTSRRRLPTLDHAGLAAALDGLGLAPCGP